MATNEILRFAETDTGTNLLTQSEYLADSQRPIGNQPGVARSKLVNKALRQASLIAAGLAEYIADNQANNITDALTPQNIADYLQAAITGALGVTPPQFDNDTSLATTAFVKRQGVEYSNVATYSAPATLTAAAAGQLAIATIAAGGTITLPAANSFAAGASITFQANNANQVIARAGSDNIYLNNNNIVTSVTLNVGDTLTLVSNGGTNWSAIAGSVQLGKATAFGSSLSASGYQRLPSGLIIQWGNAVTSGGTANVSLPLAFPSACVSVQVSAVAETNHWVQTISLSSLVLKAGLGTTTLLCIAIGY